MDQPGRAQPAVELGRERAAVAEHERHHQLARLGAEPAVRDGASIAARQRANVARGHPEGSGRARATTQKARPEAASGATRRRGASVEPSRVGDRSRRIETREDVDAIAPLDRAARGRWSLTRVPAASGGSACATTTIAVGLPDSRSGGSATVPVRRQSPVAATKPARCSAITARCAAARAIPESLERDRRERHACPRPSAGADRGERGENRGRECDRDRPGLDRRRASRTIPPRRRAPRPVRPCGPAGERAVPGTRRRRSATGSREETPRSAGK